MNFKFRSRSVASLIIILVIVSFFTFPVFNIEAQNSGNQPTENVSFLQRTFSWVKNLFGIGQRSVSQNSTINDNFLVLTPGSNSIYNIGDTIEVSWTGFNPNVPVINAFNPNHVSQIDFWLWKGNVSLGPIGFLENQSGGGEFSWTIDDDEVLDLSWAQPWGGFLTSGDNYSIKIHRSGYADPIGSTPNFSIIRQDDAALMINGNSFNIGDNIRVTWVDYYNRVETGKVDFYLWKGNTQLGPIGFLENGGAFSWTVSNDGVLDSLWSRPWDSTLIPGNDYSIRVYRSGESAPAGITGSFSIQTGQNNATVNRVTINSNHNSINSGEKVIFTIKSEERLANAPAWNAAKFKSIRFNIECAQGVTVEHDPSIAYELQGVANGLLSCENRGNSVNYKFSQDRDSYDLGFDLINTSTTDKTVVLEAIVFSDDNFTRSLGRANVTVTVRGENTIVETIRPTTGAKSINFISPSGKNDSFYPGQAVDVRWQASNLTDGRIILSVTLPGESTPAIDQILDKNVTQARIIIPSTASSGIAKFFVGNFIQYIPAYVVTDSIEVNIVAATTNSTSYSDRYVPPNAPNIRFVRPIMGQNVTAGSVIPVEWSSANLKDGNIQLYMKLPEERSPRLIRDFSLTETQYQISVPASVSGKVNLLIGNSVNKQWVTTDSIDINVIRISQGASIIDALRTLFSR